MHGSMQALILSLLPTLTTAHFQLLSPPARGYDEDTLATFPCGGQNTPSSNRTKFPLAGGPIQLNMEHDQAAVQVLLALGDDPGVNFDITLLPITQEEGIGKFCMGDITLPASAGIKDGMNGTIQVVTNGDPQGGLYNCADVTFSSSASAGECNNGTGIQAVAYKGTNTNANGTDPSSSSATSTATGSAAPATTSKGAAGRLDVDLSAIFAGAAAVAAFL